MRDSCDDRTGESILTAPLTPRRLEPNSVQDDSPVNLSRRIVRGGVLTLAARLASQVVTWLVMFFALRLLSPADYGLMVTAGLFVILASILAEAGLGGALVQKKRVSHADMAAAFTLNLLLSGGLYLMLWALSAPVAKYLEVPDLASLLRFIALVLFLVPLQMIGGAILKRRLRFGTLCMTRVVAALAQSGTLLVLAFQGYGVWALALSFVCGNIVETALLWYASGFGLAVKKPSIDNSGLFRYGLTITASSSVWYFFQNADVAVVSAVLGQVTLGHYALALLLVTAPLEKVSVVINQIVFMTFCRLQNDLKRMRRWFIRLLVLQLMIFCPALIGLALVADVAIPLVIGEKWQSAVLPIQLLAPVGIFLIVGCSFAPFFDAIGRANITLKYYCACAASLPVAFFIAIHLFGLVGICLVWLTLYPVLITGMIHITRGVTTITVADLIRATAPILIGTSFMGVVVAGIGYFLPNAVLPSFRLAALIAGGVLSYSVWMLAFARATILADILALARELAWRRTAAPEAGCATEAAPQR